MRAKPVSGTWRWRRPTAWGLAILCVLAVIEGTIIYFMFFPKPSVSDDGTLSAASLLVGSLLVICASILLTEKNRT